MPGKLMAGWLAVLMAISTTGCCRWCQRRCCQQNYQPPVAYQGAPVCCQPAPVCCPAPAPACCPAPAPACCPASSSYQPVSAAPAPAPQWQRNYGTPMTCYCN